MTIKTKHYWPIVVGLAAATFGVVSGILVASGRLKLPKPPQGG
jgi:hypothetical protein